jgi:hypothetical protein
MHLRLHQKGVWGPARALRTTLRRLLLGRTLSRIDGPEAVG